MLYFPGGLPVKHIRNHRCVGYGFQGQGRNKLAARLGWDDAHLYVLLAQAAESFDKNCVAGIVPNERRMKDNLDKNLMLATALSPVVGYDRAAFIVKTARKEGLTLKQAALKLGFLTEEQFDKAIEKATQPQ